MQLETIIEEPLTLPVEEKPKKKRGRKSKKSLKDVVKESMEKPISVSPESEDKEIQTEPINKLKEEYTGVMLSEEFEMRKKYLREQMVRYVDDERKFLQYSNGLNKLLKKRVI